MTITSYPRPTSPIATDLQWRDITEPWQSNGVLRGVGLEFGYGAPGAMIVSLATGGMNIDGIRFESDVQINMTIPTSNPSNPRIDRIVGRIDRNTNTMYPVVIQGTANVSPTPPSPQANDTKMDILLYQVRVEAGVTSIAWKRHQQIVPRQSPRCTTRATRRSTGRRLSTSRNSTCTESNGRQTPLWT